MSIKGQNTMNPLAAGGPEDRLNVGGRVHWGTKRSRWREKCLLGHNRPLGRLGKQPASSEPRKERITGCTSRHLPAFVA
jgi:hypothetical protein